METGVVGGSRKGSDLNHRKDINPLTEKPTGVTHLLRTKSQIRNPETKDATI